MDLLRFAVVVRPEMLEKVRRVQVRSEKREGLEGGSDRRKLMNVKTEISNLSPLVRCRRELEGKACLCIKCVRKLQGVGSNLEVQEGILLAWERIYLGPEKPYILDRGSGSWAEYFKEIK